MANEIISTQKAPGAIGPYSQAVRAGDMLFTSGQLGLNPETGVLAEGVRAQADQALKNLGAILHEAGLDYKGCYKDGCIHKEHGRLQDRERGLRPVLYR